MTTWFAQLDRAKSIPEVVLVARDFFASWTPAELALLPQHCRPGRVRDEQDIETMHGMLVEEYRVSRATGQELEYLQRLTSFIVRASIRLAELGVPASDGAGDPSSGSSKSMAPSKR